MKYTIETIPHDKQRYPTVGDWIVKPEGVTIRISKMSDERYEFLVAMHEFVEVFTALRAGITQEKADAFDMQYEADRMHGKYTLEQEPGDDPDSPYRKQHFLATNIERIMAEALGVDWSKYSHECALL